MSLKYCSECGKLYSENLAGICFACQDAEEELAETVTEFLREAKTATLEDVHKATGIKHKVILRMIRSGRIQLNKGEAFFFNCEGCGAPIADGRFCDACNQRLSKELSSKSREMMQNLRPESRPDLQKSKSIRMYTADSDK